jgi:hypothetical protein
MRLARLDNSKIASMADAKNSDSLQFDPTLQKLATDTRANDKKIF